MIPYFMQETIYFLLGKKAPWDVSDLPLSLSKKERKHMRNRMKSMYQKYYLATFNIENNIWESDSENFSEGWDCRPAYYNLEYSYPLADRRIVEFLGQVPIAHFYAGGLRRGLIRKAMTGVLPEKIRMRMDKMPYSPADELIYNRDLHKIQDLLRRKDFQNEINNMLDTSKMDGLIDNITESKKSSKYLPYYWQIIALSVWIKHICWTRNNRFAD